MKKLTTILFSIALSVSGLNAQNSNEVIYVKSPRFASQLVEKWVESYKAEHPDSNIKFTDKKDQAADLEFTLQEENQNNSSSFTWVSRYALLPVTSSQNPALEQINKKKLSKKDIRGLFFIEDIFDDENSKKLKYQDQITVYSSNNSVVGAQVFANHFGYKVSDIRGKKISGDDVFLLNALNKDNTGITFNHLSYLYDTESRQLKKDITILPLDLKKDWGETLASANIDELLLLLENQSIDLIPVQAIGFSSQSDNEDAISFLKWVLTEGQKHNHTYGFLQLDQPTLAAQQSQLERPLLSRHP